MTDGSLNVGCTVNGATTEFRRSKRVRRVLFIISTVDDDRFSLSLVVWAMVSSSISDAIVFSISFLRDDRRDHDEAACRARRIQN